MNILVAHLAVFLLAMSATSPQIRAAEPNAILNRWLASQTNVITWQADFLQTRTLSTLSQPLTTNGRVWFAAPKRFRWQLGDPPETIAIRQPHRVVILYPKLKRAEEYALVAGGEGMWKDLMELLDMGFPRSRADLEEPFRVLSLGEEDGGRHVLTLGPRSSAFRRMVAEVRLEFSLVPSRLLATQMKFTDGSTLRNDFSNIVVNAELSDEFFKLEMDKDFKISRPPAR